MLNDLQMTVLDLWQFLKPHAVFISAFLLTVIVGSLFRSRTKIRTERPTRKKQADRPRHKKPAEDLKNFCDLSYRQLPLMSETEINFFVKLQLAFPGYFIFPQIGASGLVGIESQPYNRSHFFSALNWVDTARVDFTLCDPQGKVVALIELDDASHDDQKERDEARNYIYRAAGYRLFRFDCRQMPDSAYIKAQILRKD
ncbi:MAG: DUF2726 domain-containing protein [Candidatus Adiutrix sp.]|jgi:hypothetical protein|nr:DUF2726 domain-containing protein [Candidatus Adiutrix sp.]